MVELRVETAWIGGSQPWRRLGAAGGWARLANRIAGALAQCVRLGDLGGSRATGDGSGHGGQALSVDAVDTGLERFVMGLIQYG